MDPLPGRDFVVAPAPDRAQHPASPAFRLARSRDATEPGRYLAFFPFECLELDLDDPEQRDFGDFELLELLGQGGMGVVYRAHQRSLQREVALKLLTAGPWATPDFVARFQREARAAARLHHPNILPVFEIGQHSELNFFTMALVRGESLAQRVERVGRLDPRQAARLLRTISEALDYAHRFGILHLDL
ncbi:MAG: serine/threonine-protein kinase, partial [Lysobacterales bacterium]